MSAIGGYLAFRNDFIDNACFSEMSSSLEQGGPDRSAFIRSGAFGAFHHLLATTPEDLLDTQPIETGSFVFVGDLRVDNREDLIAELGKHSVQLSKLPDSQLALEAFLKWGSNCVEHLIGEFAFAVWNKPKSELFLARDQRGFRPLFYHCDSNGFAFASLPHAFFKIPRIKPILNRRKAVEFLVLHHADHRNTFFDGIHRLPPGHSMIVRNATPKPHRYWSLNPEYTLRLKSDEAYVEKADELVSRCVSASLRTHKKLGAFLSAGLDSSTVVWYAARQLADSNAKLHTFTQCPSPSFNEKEGKRYFYDESKLVTAIADGIPNIETHLHRSTELWPHFFDQTRHAHLGSPTRNPLNHLWLDGIAKSAAGKGIRVLLTGQSGNFSLSYNGLYLLAGLLKTGKFIELAKELALLQTNALPSWPRLLASKGILPLLPQSFRTKRARSQLLKELQNHPFSALRLEPEYLEWISELPINSPRNGRGYRTALLEGSDYIGELSQYYARSAGVELRDPLGDIRLVEFCLALPDSQYLSQGRQRWLIRRLMAGRIPDTVIDKRQRGFQFADWFAAMQKERERLTKSLESIEKSNLASQLLDIEGMRKLINAWPTANHRQFEVLRNYRYRLMRGIETGRFILWAESLCSG